MILCTGTPVRQGSTPYNHFNNSLLFQFILADFIRAFECIQQLDALSNLGPVSTLEGARRLHKPEMPHRIETLLAQLLGPKSDARHSVPWGPNEGILSKIRALCTLFLQNSDNEEKELIALQYYADKVWNYCSQGCDALKNNQGKRPSVAGALEKASHAMNRFAKLIARIALQFRDDENVIYFFLRHREQFDKLYGKRFMSKLLIRMFPKGVREIEFFLTKKYLDRNFDDMALQITSKIAELEASGT